MHLCCSYQRAGFWSNNISICAIYSSSFNASNAQRAEAVRISDSNLQTYVLCKPVYTHIHECVYVYICVCMFRRKPLLLRISDSNLHTCLWCKLICTRICVSMYICVCIYICMCVYVQAEAIRISDSKLHTCVWCKLICTRICVCMYIYVYIYIYMCVYVQAATLRSLTTTCTHMCGVSLFVPAYVCVYMYVYVHVQAATLQSLTATCKGYGQCNTTKNKCIRVCVYAYVCVCVCSGGCITIS
jgi:hypothetical protein